MNRLYNFSAGPSALPEKILQQAAAEMMNWQNSGASVMEVSHRSDKFIELAQQSEADLRRLMAIPDDYSVLFMQGGATAQFSMIPLNLLDGGNTADYVDSGHWAHKAIAEARRYCDVNVVASTQLDGEGLKYLPDYASWQCNDRASWLHITPNETIDGIEMSVFPDTDVPLVADCSSCILSRPVDVSKFGMIYAGAQKNIGPAGLTLVIIRNDLLERKAPLVPSVFNYKRIADNRSMLNTPPVFAWYMASLTFKWLLDRGGLAAMAEINHHKAERLYRFIDGNDCYRNSVARAFRSRMNVPFSLVDESQQSRFLSEARTAGLTNLKGHRSVGGMRASIYNAVSEAAVDSLIAFMRDFSLHS